MVTRTKLILLGCGLSIATLLPLLPLTSSPAPQESTARLKDVCPEGWTRYGCQLVRLCVSPEVESQYPVAKTLEDKSTGCGRPDDRIVPEVWTHATPYEVGWREKGQYGGYNFYSKVAKLDSSTIKNGDLNDAIASLHLNDPSTDWNNGWHDYLNTNLMSLETYDLALPPPKTPVKEVCPTGWSRFSCEFVRLCVAPSVTNRYNLTTSKEFGNARCEMDNRSVGEQDTHSSPHEVGKAAAALLLGPRYVGVVKLDSPDIFDGNIDEAIQRLVLVPIPTNALIEYARGAKEGEAMFRSYLSKNRQKEKEIEGAKNPH